jgi:hypothetical protein
MTKNIEYTFNDGENTTSIDRKSETIRMDERSGWGRSYSITFKELLKNAKDWDVKVKLTDPDEVIAEVATNIILANNSVTHGLDPFRYIPRTKKVTDPSDLEVLKGFEALLKQYGSTQVISQLSAKSQKALKEALD